YVAGASSYFALKKRSHLQYLGERLSKLLLPAITGLILLVPPMTYLSLVSRGITVNFWQHYIGFWQIDPIDISGINGKFTPAHLWFLIFLFIYSLVALPLFSLLSKEKLQSRFRMLIDRTGTLPILLVLFVFLVLSARLNILGDKNPVYYFLMFFFGYLLMMDKRFQHSLDQYAFRALGAGIVCEFIREFLYSSIPEWANPNLTYFLIGQLNRWVWLLAILGLGHRFLNQSNRLLKYLSSASFPFYLLHLLMNTLVAFYVIKLPIGIGPKYLIIVIVTIASTFGLYEIIRRIPVLRYLLGIKKANAPSNPADRKKNN
ncbi:MAG TPA: acyltransferase family protein, partial [Prolixibacteraceae bacterium]|nr:acyltransferase family protein [Prolixibacteraceae bacterium]